MGARGRLIWLLPAALASTIAHAQTFNCQVPIPTLKDRMIQESISRYPGNCPCPYNRDAHGHRCGKRSAWNRAGGYVPLCFAEDISADMVRVRRGAQAPREKANHVATHNANVLSHLCKSLCIAICGPVASVMHSDVAHSLLPHSNIKEPAVTSRQRAFDEATGK